MADDINLPNLVSHLQVNLADTNGIVADAARQGSSVGAALGQSMREEVSRAVDHIPEVELDADSTELDRDLARVRRDLRRLADTRIGVDISVEDALRRMAELEPHLERLEQAHPSINVRAAVAGARADLEEMRLAARRVDDTDVTIDVHTDTTRSTSALTGLRRVLSGIPSALASVGPALGSLGQIAAIAGGAIPVVAGLVATLEQIAPAAAVGVPAVLGIGSAVAAVKVGTRGVGDAISAAFAPAKAAGGGAAAAMSGVADAQRNLKDAIQQAALANQQALRRVGDAERNLADAQKAALAAQKAVNAARVEATRDLQDLNNQLVDAKLDERQAVRDVEDAEANLAAVRAKGAAASEGEQDDAQLQYDRAVQRLKEQQLAVQRLQQDTTAANKAGVDGSATVRDAQQKVADTSRDVADRQRDVSDALAEVTRTAQQGAEAVDRAREALAKAGAAGSAGAGGVDAFDAAMAKLSPAARAFVKEIISLRPQLDALKLDVQQKLFDGLDRTLDRTAKATLPVFQQSLDDSATALNGMAKGTADAATELAENGTLGKALAGANKGISNLVPIPGLFVKALGQIGVAAAPAFDRLTAKVTEVTKGISDKLDKGFKSGGLEKAIDAAVDTLGELLGVGRNVLTIIGNILAPAHATGGGVIGILSQVTAALAAATDTEGFQDALTALFSAMAEVGRVGGGLLAQALGDLEPVLSHLGPPAMRLVDALGKALSPILDALAPLLVTAADAVGALADQADPLLEVAGQLVAALGPSLQPILDALVQVIGDLPIRELADDVSRILTPVLAALPGVIKPLADLIAQQLGYELGILAQLLADNGPAFAQLGVSVANLLVALGPLITQLAVLNTDLLVAATPLILLIADAATRLATVLTDDLSTVINGLIIPALTVLTDLLSGKWGAAWDEAKDHAGSAIKGMVILVAGMPLAAAQALAPLAKRLRDKVDDAGNAMLASIESGTNDVVFWLAGLPEQALGALGDLSDYLYDSGRALLTGFISGIASKIGDLKNTVSGALGKVKDFFPNSPAKTGPFSGRGWTHFSGQAVMDDWGGGMLAAVPALVAAVGRAVGAAQDAMAVALPGGYAVPSAGALAATYAGSAAPAQGPTTINLFGTDATPEGVSAALSWRSKVGRK